MSTHHVLTAPDGSTKYLAPIVEATLAKASSREVLEVQCPDSEAQLALADWCLTAGHKIRNPFAHYLDHRLFIENMTDTAF